MSINRYSIIKNKFPREFILLQGKGCKWRKCTFCDYYLDTTNAPFNINKDVINSITGFNSTLDIINSGSAMELDSQTIKLLKEKIESLNIKTVWFEAHWMYRKLLNRFSENFPNSTVKYRIGVETFNPMLRNKWNKGIGEDVTPKEIAKYFNGVCLLVGIEGQTKDDVKRDINIALEYFEYFSINVFNLNSTDTKRDQNLIEWFIKDLMPKINKEDRIEILLNNTDLGVG